MTAFGGLLGQMDMAKFANKGTSSADRKTRFMQMMLTWLHTDSLQVRPQR